jgi:hypothetical protein
MATKKHAPRKNRLGGAFADPLAPTRPQTIPPPPPDPVDAPGTAALERALEPPVSPIGRRQTRAHELGEAGYKAGGRRPAADLEDVAPVRMTAYLRPDQVLRLRAEVRKRQAKGKRADLSALLRELIDATYPPLGR